MAVDVPEPEPGQPSNAAGTDHTPGPPETSEPDDNQARIQDPDMDSGLQSVPKTSLELSTDHSESEFEVIDSEPSTVRPSPDPSPEKTSKPGSAGASGLFGTKRTKTKKTCNTQ